jgi:hypothetical protein
MNPLNKHSNWFTFWFSKDMYAFSMTIMVWFKWLTNFIYVVIKIDNEMIYHFSTIPLVYGSAHYGAGTLPIHLDDVKCTGTESSLFNCPHRGWGSNNCGHGEDVGIYCATGNLSTNYSLFEIWFMKLHIWVIWITMSVRKWWY